MSVVTLDGTLARAVSPEGLVATMPVAELCERLAPRHPDTSQLVMPDGFKLARSSPGVTVFALQIAPRLHCLKWIAADSPVPYGPRARYREVRIALPYLIVLATFVTGRDGRRQLGQANECFFRTEPLDRADDQLYYPALLNCSKFDPNLGKPLSWICTQYLDRSPLAAEHDPSERLARSIRALLHCLLESGFNLSSEQHELASWFTLSTGIDPRVSTVEAWEEASRADPLFVLDVPWLPVGLSLARVVDRILDNHAAARRGVSDAADVARVVFHHGSSEASRREDPDVAP